MSTELEKKYQIDILAQQAGGYFSAPSEQELAYTDFLFDVCDQLGIHYYKATPKERHFMERIAMEIMSGRMDDKPEPTDPFYSRFNQAILKQSITEYEAGQAKTVAKSLDELNAVIAE